MAAESNMIYIVDDDPSVHDALSIVFDMEGFRVESFDNGDAVLMAAAREEPASVILDVHMPGRSGIDILKGLNAEEYPAPVSIISGQGDIPMAVNAIKQGAFDFIEKPFDADAVVQRVRDGIAASARRGDRGDKVRNFPAPRP